MLCSLGRLAELGDSPGCPVAIVCRSDRRSAKAAALLARRGFADARVVRSRMTACLAQGWAVGDRSNAATEGAKV